MYMVCCNVIVTFEKANAIKNWTLEYVNIK